MFANFILILPGILKKGSIVELLILSHVRDVKVPGFKKHKNLNILETLFFKQTKILFLLFIDTILIASISYNNTICQKIVLYRR